MEIKELFKGIVITFSGLFLFFLGLDLYLVGKEIYGSGVLPIFAGGMLVMISILGVVGYYVNLINKCKK